MCALKSRKAIGGCKCERFGTRERPALSKEFAHLLSLIRTVSVRSGADPQSQSDLRIDRMRGLCTGKSAGPRTTSTNSGRMQQVVDRIVFERMRETTTLVLLLLSMFRLWMNLRNEWTTYSELRCLVRIRSLRLAQTAGYHHILFHCVMVTAISHVRNGLVLSLHDGSRTPGELSRWTKRRYEEKENGFKMCCRGYSIRCFMNIMLYVVGGGVMGRSFISNTDITLRVSVACFNSILIEIVF